MKMELCTPRPIAEDDLSGLSDLLDDVSFVPGA